MPVALVAILTLLPITNLPPFLIATGVPVLPEISTFVPSFILTSLLTSKIEVPLFDLIDVEATVEAAFKITIEPLAFVLLLKFEPEMFTPESASIATTEVVIVTLWISTTDEPYV